MVFGSRVPLVLIWRRDWASRAVEFKLILPANVPSVVLAEAQLGMVIGCSGPVTEPAGFCFALRIGVCEPGDAAPLVNPTSIVAPVDKQVEDRRVQRFVLHSE